MCNGVTSISDDKAGIAFSHLLPYTRPRQTDTWNKRKKSAREASGRFKWSLNSPLLTIMTTAAKKNAFCWIGALAPFCIQIRGDKIAVQRKLCLPSSKLFDAQKKGREKIQSKPDKMTLRSFEKAFFFFLVNWLTKLLLWPNTSAPGLFKKKKSNEFEKANSLSTLSTMVFCSQALWWFAIMRCTGHCALCLLFSPLFFFQTNQDQLSGFERQRRFYFVCCLSVTSPLHWEDGRLLMSLLASLVVK